MGIKVYVDEDNKEVRVDLGVDEYVTLRPSIRFPGEIAVGHTGRALLDPYIVSGKKVYESKSEPTPEPEGDFAYTHGPNNQPLVKYNGWWHTALSKHGVTWNEIVHMYPNAKEAE